MALDESGGYDLARGFDTLVTGNKAIEQAIRDLQQSVMSALAMQRDTTMGASGQTPQSMNPGVAEAARAPALAGQVATSAQTVPGTPGGLVAVGTPQTAPSLPPPQADPQAGATTQTAPASPSAGLGLPTATESNGTGSGLIDSVLNVLPFGDKISEAMDFAREQRDAGGQFQQIEGGSNWSGQQERLHMKGYQMSTAGMFSGDEADKAFMGVTALGYGQESDNGGPGEQIGRQDALNFAYKQKSASNQTVDESLVQLEAFSKSATANLTQFSDAIISVGAAAREGGVNAAEAKALFLQTFSQATSAGLGEGSVSYAQAMTNQSSSYGMAYQQNVDVSGTTSMDQLRTQSAMQGKSLTQTMYQSQKGVNTAAMGQQAAMKKLLDMFGPDTIKWAKEQLATDPPTEPEAIVAFGWEMVKRGGVDIQGLVMAAEAYTSKSYGNPDALLTEIVQTLMGNGLNVGAASVGRVGDINNPDDTSYQHLNEVNGVQSQTGQDYAEYASDNPSVSRIGNLEQVLNRAGDAGVNLDEQTIKLGGKETTISEILASGDKKKINKLVMGKGTFTGGAWDGQTVGKVGAEDVVKEGEDNMDTSATDVNVSIDFSQMAKDWLMETHNVDGVPPA